MVDLRSLSTCRRSSGKTLCSPFTLRPPLARFSILHYFFQFIVTTMRYIRFATAAILAAVPFSNAYGVNLPKPVSNVKATSPSISRQNFLAVMAGGLSAGLISNEAWAKDADSKGTKKDPVFEACLSQCMYDCTKPKGDEQKSRKECLPDCKTQCAKTDAQLMKGTPKAQNVDMGV